LIGCASTPETVTKIERVPVDIPVQLKTCLEYPHPPEDPTQRDVGVHIVKAFEAWADCHSKLERIKELNDGRN